MTTGATTISRRRTDKSRVIVNTGYGRSSTAGQRHPGSQGPMELWCRATELGRQTTASGIIDADEQHPGKLDAAALSATIEEIQQLDALDPDWNDEGAPAIVPASILHAVKFARWLAYVAAEQGLAGDIGPDVFPTIEGGVMLYWQVEGRQVALTFDPNQTSIDAMVKPLGVPASHRAMAEDDAGDVALEAMRSLR